MNVILRVIATAIAVWVAALLLPGISVQTQDDTGSAAVTFLLIAVVIGLVNTIVKPIAQVLSGCFIILTFGLFLLVVNAAMLMPDRATTMRRPSGPLSTKADFISGLATGAKRQTTMLDLELHGRYRATARCTVEKWALADPEAVQIFDNLRVFIRENGRWQLITWLAEPI